MAPTPLSARYHAMVRFLLPAMLAMLTAGPARAADRAILRLTLYSDTLANISGGAIPGTAQIFQLDANLTLDADALWGWRQTKFYLRGFANNGDSIGAFSGDAMGIDSWETGRREARLIEAWVDHEFAAGRIGVRAGLYDTTTDFDSSRTDAFFLNNAAGMNTPMLVSGRGGPPTFPATAPGVRVRWLRDDHWTLKAAVMDGVSGNAAVMTVGPHGALLLGEARYHDDSGRRLVLGAWRYTASFDRIDAPIAERGQQGLYLAGDVMLYHRADAPLKGLSLGGRIALSDQRFARFDRFGNIGLTYNDLRAGHDDRAGLGAFCTETSAGFRARQETPVGNRECTIEATYRRALRPWLFVQPDLQYVFNPIYAPDAGHTLVVGLRLVVTADSSLRR
ncbi:MAG: carbohydrate porin [Sandarakinorhabdus sp.]|nr:carbohydrate porin [Sandarakinorhabdus sp.]